MSRIDNWETRPLSALATFYSGGTPSKANAGFWGGETPWITVRDMTAPKLNETLLTLTAEGAAATRVMPPGTVFILVRGMALFKRLPVVYSEEAAAFNQDIKALIPATDVDGRFLAIALAAKKQQILQLVDHAGHGTGRLDTDKLKSAEVLLPPLPEQRKIAEILQTWDETIATSQSLGTRLEERRNAVIANLLQQNQFMHRFGNIGDQAENSTSDKSWALCAIGDVARETGIRNGSGTFEVLSCTKHKGFVRSKDYFGRAIHSADLSNYKIVRRGEFGFPSNHIEEGSIGLQDIVDVGIVSPIYIVFAFDEDIIDSNFAYTVLKTPMYAHLYRAGTSSSVDRRGNLRWREFSKLPFPVPTLEEQRKIVKLVAEMDKEREGSSPKLPHSAPKSTGSCKSS